MDPHFELIDESRILRHLNTLLGSKSFCGTPRLREFLQFVVTETLAGRANQVKERSIGINVYGREPDFDPKEDPIVRVQAVKLRARLAEYYSLATSTDEIEILLPNGGYVPKFRPSQRESLNESLIAELCAAADFAVWRRTPDGVALAREHFSRVIELQPSDPRGHIGLAESCRSAMDMELESPAGIVPCFERELREALRLSPGSSHAHVLHSNFIYATGDIGSRALAEIHAALRLDPGNARAHFWRAAVLSAQGFHAEAIREVHEAVRLEPQSSLFQAYVGRVLFYAGEPERAVEKLIEVTRLDPALLSAHLWLALALSESGRFEEAIVTASESLNRDKNPVTRCCLSYVLARAGCREEASGILSSLLPPFTNRYVSPVWLASIYTALDMQNQAAKQLESASNENSYALIWRKTDPRLKGRARASALSCAQTISPAVARRVSGLLSSMLSPKQTAYNLTPHEMRLLKLLIEGHNYKTAAAAMGVSFNTIAFHMKNIYQKLQVHSKSEAVAKALRSKLIG